MKFIFHLILVETGKFSYGTGHSMNPKRLIQMHNLVVNSGLDKFMIMKEPPKATEEQLLKFHDPAYIQAIREKDPATVTKEFIKKFGLGGTDNPLFAGLYEFCQWTAGGSLASAAELNCRASQICVNWAGGLHHAWRAKSSGFCPVNDAILAILELLKCHQRVLYIDIDCHHGDAVEASFANTNRVMTVSFHKYGLTKRGKMFFPRTGKSSDVGIGEGKYFAVNVPLMDGIDDASYASVFEPIMNEVLSTFDAGAIVMQCGGDSLGGDPLGPLNLTTRGHGSAVQFIVDRQIPLILLGGGGYNASNVSRLWAYETSIAVGVELPEKLPFHDYYQEYVDENYMLHTKAIDFIKNENTPKYLTEITNEVLRNLRSTGGVPSVHIQTIPLPAVQFAEVDDVAMEQIEPGPSAGRHKRATFVTVPK